MSGHDRIDPHRAARAAAGDWQNWVLAQVNDHVLRISVMARDFHWHRHMNSDEVLMPIVGELIVDFEAESMTLRSGEFVRVPRGVLHRTRPGGERVVTLSFEHRDTDVTGD